MSFKNILFIFVFYFYTLEIYANNKNKIINQLDNLNSLEFTFNQMVNSEIEKGSCLLKFPGKLKCQYFDTFEKEIIINNKKLAITQRRYNKTYYYPISESPFLNILYKDKLFELINNGIIKSDAESIKLVNKYENKIIIYFDKTNLDLKGWKIEDQYNNKINFDLKIQAKNDYYEDKVFKLPKIN